MDFTEHASYSYPHEFAAMPVRELARRSQTDITPDPELGLQFAAAAYDKGLLPEVQATDPTVAGEAAAKAGLRTAQLDRPAEEVVTWFNRSYDALDIDNPRAHREFIATALLDGRTFALRALKNHSVFESARATAAFADAEGRAQILHKAGTRWDPYATMLSRHWATHEAVRETGTGRNAASIALRGIWRAARAQRETANAPELSSKASIAGHTKFIGKQLLMNTAALSLAVSRPFNKLPKVAAARRAFAAKLLG